MQPLLFCALAPLTERECIDRLIELRWGRRGPLCTCGGKAFRTLKTRIRVIVCRTCAAHKSVTAGTLLHGCHVPVRAWFIAAALIARPGGCSAKELQRRIKTTYETAWQILHRLRTGAQDPARFVAGRLSLAVINIRTTRPYRDGGPPQPFVPHFSTVASMADKSTTLLELVQGIHSAVPWASDITGVEHPLAREGPAVFALLRLKMLIKYTHLGVSERWLPHYISEALDRENNVASNFLIGVLNADRARFDDLRPRLEAYPKWSGQRQYPCTDRWQGHRRNQC